MIKGRLKNGFDITLQDEALDDFEVFEALCNLDEEDADMKQILFVYRRLLGKEQYEALKAYLTEKDGRISLTEMMEILKEILEMSDETKNS